jgi:anionic cell wall polymer biosynthesis LytR-Cps2A-Psr (LCP) family protein
MSRKKKLTILAVAAAILVLCACAIIGGYALWNIPLGTPLVVETVSTLPAQEEISIPPMGGNPTAAVSSSQSATPPAVNCGQSGSWNILILGVDSPILPGPNGPLDIRVGKVDFSRKSAAVFSFPRDLWLPIRGLEGFGFTQTRLGEAYLIARSNAGFPVAAATNLLANNLYDNFGVVSDHYITLKMSTLSAIIDAVGGISLNIPVPYDGTPYGFHYFPAGTYRMNGVLALEYAIAPTSLNQWDALDRKNLVLTALVERLFSPDVIPSIPALIPQFLQVATTDLSMQQIMDLVCISQQIPKEQMTIAGVGPADVSNGIGGVLYPNWDSIRAKVQQYLAP